MASSSSAATTSPRSCTYDVFLSFRGIDTRRNFTDHLFEALTRMGIRTFRDDRELEKGGVISDELPTAIEESMFAIVVLSPNYATSTWCLQELHKIVECKDKLSVLPVFYGVVASDVRHQKGSFEKAFREHEKIFGHDSDEVKRWRHALEQVAGYSGWDSNNEFEATLVKTIAQHVHKKVISKLPSCAKNLVGIFGRVEKVIRLMDIGLDNVVHFVGIWGMGGIGKTTLARVVYEAIQSEFEVSCFLANVREMHEKNALVEAQKELLASMSISTNAVTNEYDGRRAIRHSLCKKKVLLVLDDVSKEIQLKNLAEEQDWFGRGSRILITTRNVQLLKTHEVHGTYYVERLHQNKALHLFCLKAFKQDKPKQGYLDLSKEIVEHTNALPLALEVLGSYLYDKPVGVWRSTVRAINNAPYSEILEQLKISYDGLGELEKNIFLDIACFFKGMRIGEVTDILEKCDYNAESGIDTLVDRSLVTLNPRYKELEMHDLLQEMGRNIVKGESRNPGEHSRLWSRKDIDLVLTKHMGSAKIESIVVLGDRGTWYGARWSPKAFKSMSMLRLLKISCDVALPSGLNYLPSSLKVLHWDYCPLKTLPFADDEQCDLVEIVMKKSSIEQLWHGETVLEKLECLKLRSSMELKQTPDLSRVPNLKVLCLRESPSLTDVHPSLMHHKNLVELDLSECDSLKTLPGKLEMSSLELLRLNFCYSFENLPEFGECMVHLSSLILTETAIRELPTSIGYLVGLEYLELNNCKNLVYLPDTINGLKSLKRLRAPGCSNLGRLSPWGPSVLVLPSLMEIDLDDCSLTEELFPHHNLLDLPSLTHLDLSCNDFVSIPVSIHELPKLKVLKLNGCRKLKFLPKLPPSVRSVEARNCESLYTSQFNILSMASSVDASC